ncbi:glycosyltransferase family 4 protein [Brevibacillus borstelensis]|uniref:glycosyltransferase family 4 protein n=1 Tax=Brevibacillus borstelensis TaxID=45462 RepID=UPI0030C0EB39
MRILIATYWYLPHVGGVNTYVNVLRKELMAAGHQVDVFAHHPDMQKYYMVHTGRYLSKAKIKQVVYDNVLKYYDTSQPYVEDWVRWREIERYAYELAAISFDLKQYDLIHTQDIISTRALSRVKPPKVPLVATIHGLLATEHMIAGDVKSKQSIPWKYVCKEEYYGATSATKTMVPTSWLKRKLSEPEYGVPAKLLHTVPYGMDTSQFLGKYNSPTYSYIPPVESGKTVLICPARLVPVKGHRYLLEGLHKLKQKRSDFVCWLIGNGPLYDEMVALANSLGISDVVHFFGDRDDVPQLLKQSHILVLPSVQDNHPFSIMEAQVAGKLVVASNAGGIPEMVSHKKTGFIFSKRNSADLASKLDYVLSHPALARQVAERGRRWGLNRWAPSTLLKKTMSIYLSAMEKVGK